MENANTTAIIIWTVFLSLIAAAALAMTIYLMATKDDSNNDDNDTGGGDTTRKSGFRATLAGNNAVSFTTGDTVLGDWNSTQLDYYDPMNFDASTGIFTVPTKGKYNIKYTAGMDGTVGGSVFSLIRSRPGGTTSVLGLLETEALSSDVVEFSTEVELEAGDQVYITGQLPTAGGVKQYETTAENSLDFYGGLVLNPRAILADSADTIDGPVFKCVSKPPEEYQVMVEFPVQNGTRLDPAPGSLSGFSFQNNNFETIDDGKNFELNTEYKSQTDGSGSGATFRVLTLSGVPSDKQAGVVQIVNAGSGYSAGDTVTIINPNGTNIDITVEWVRSPNLIVQNTGSAQRSAVAFVHNSLGVSDDAILEITPSSLPLTNYFEGGMVVQTVDTNVGSGTGAEVLIQYEAGDPRMKSIFLIDGGTGYDPVDDVSIGYFDENGMAQNLGLTIDAVSRTNYLQRQLITTLPRSSKVEWDLALEGKSVGEVEEVVVKKPGYDYAAGTQSTTNTVGTGTGLTVAGGDASFQGGGGNLVDLDIVVGGTGYAVGDTFSVDGNTTSGVLGDTVSASAEVTLLSQGKALFYNEISAKLFIAELSDPFHHLQAGDCFTYSGPSDQLAKVIVVSDVYPLIGNISTSTFTITEN